MVLHNFQPPGCRCLELKIEKIIFDNSSFVFVWMCLQSFRCYLRLTTQSRHTHITVKGFLVNALRQLYCLQNAQTSRIPKQQKQLKATPRRLQIPWTTHMSTASAAFLCSHEHCRQIQPLSVALHVWQMVKNMFHALHKLVPPKISLAPGQSSQPEHNSGHCLDFLLHDPMLKQS